VLEWRVPDTQGQPIAGVGLAVEDSGREGVVHLDYLTWDGEPHLLLTRPPAADEPKPPAMWRRAWVNGVDRWDTYFGNPYRLIQNEGRGLILQGTRGWRDIEVSATINSMLMQAGGIALRAQGMRRYYALLLCAGGMVRLVKALGGERVLAERSLAWELNRDYVLNLWAQGAHLRAWLDGELLFDLEDQNDPLLCGGVALVCEEGHFTCDSLAVRPAESS
jgi:hypothetical protein